MYVFIKRLILEVDLIRYLLRREMFKMNFYKLFVLLVLILFYFYIYIDI